MDSFIHFWLVERKYVHYIFSIVDNYVIPLLKNVFIKIWDITVNMYLLLSIFMFLIGLFFEQTNLIFIYTSGD